MAPHHDTQNRPTLFEISAAHQLDSLVKPAVRYVLAWYGQQSFVMSLSVARLVSLWFDEAFALAFGAVAAASLLSNTCGGVAERFYGLKRVVRNNAVPSRAQRITVLLAAVLLPYIRDRAEDFYQVASEISQDLRTPNQTRILRFWPKLKLMANSLSLATAAAYMFNKVDAVNPIDVAMRLALVRMTQQDYKDIADHQETPLFPPKSALSKSPLRNAATIASAAFLKSIAFATTYVIPSAIFISPLAQPTQVPATAPENLAKQDHLTKTLASELIHKIFAYLSPRQIASLATLNIRIHSCLSDPHFALLNLKIHLCPPTQDPTSPNEGYFYGPLLESTLPDDFDRGFFLWNQGYQQSLIELRYKPLIRINWEAKRMTGSIPHAIGALEKKLTILSLGGNLLTGGIPSSLGRLVHLTYLSLARTPLGGVIPKELGNLQSMVYMALNGCELSGEIPPELGNMRTLTTLYLGGNAGLGGAIPKQLGDLSNLTRLHLNSNRFCGQLPIELGKLTMLTELLLNNNKLEGPLLDSFGGFTALERLDVSNNRFSGVIPGLEGLERLESLHVLGNELDFDEGRVRSLTARIRRCDLTTLKWV
ncbi:ubiquitin-protein ligase peroxin 12 [Podochytrium sp. JEL0797]|nr:ubiquitin-protein ligase peroxin 12 [Podochytrium sp. JEL0797]